MRILITLFTLQFKTYQKASKVNRHFMSKGIANACSLIRVGYGYCRLDRGRYKLALHCTSFEVCISNTECGSA